MQHRTNHIGSRYHLIPELHISELLFSTGYYQQCLIQTTINSTGIRQLTYISAQVGCRNISIFQSLPSSPGSSDAPGARSTILTTCTNAEGRLLLLLLRWRLNSSKCWRRCCRSSKGGCRCSKGCCWGSKGRGCCRCCTKGVGGWC